MNKENAVHFLPLVKALALGETIQVSSHGETWRDLESISFGLPPSHYRIKPKERYVIAGVDSTWIGCGIYHDKRVADDVLSRLPQPANKVYKLVEVTS